MEFKLNKIDTELRQQVKDTTKPGVIHRKELISVNKDRNPKENSKSHEEFKDKLSQYRKKHKITVEAYKNKEFDIEVFKENKDDRNIGTFLDIKK